eukprot:CAMPEP_0195101106 /NCGR_PEP_ID=MMETSP0448-20130528/64914_1 /TAXON_ID=66468 /ORGANISM="Heterocapsa triquestra, Strain CCMP 448" /LENGTH=95 /DNA_ID=CAMNT_0040136359 /DNA_START=83 /DNA_END=367 /DNA_ORIENTATION=+
MSTQGTVKFFNPEKGFGFITYEGGDVFVHRSECEGGMPQDGDIVQFELTEDTRSGKMKAVGVTGGTGSFDSVPSKGKGGKGFGGKGKDKGFGGGG